MGRIGPVKKFIAVAGNMGVGKTSMVEFLHAEYGLDPAFEPYTANPYLDDFYGPSLVGYVPTATRTVSTDFAAFAPAYPNPTSGLTQLPFSLKKAATVSLAVYDNLGRRVSDLLRNEQRAAGQYSAELNAAKLAPGLYTCRLTVDGVALSRSLSVE